MVTVRKSKLLPTSATIRPNGNTERIYIEFQNNSSNTLSITHKRLALYSELPT